MYPDSFRGSRQPFGQSSGQGMWAQSTGLQGTVKYDLKNKQTDRQNKFKIGTEHSSLQPVTYVEKKKDFCDDSLWLQLLRDVGISTDLIPVGREVAGVVQQGCFHTNPKETCN